MSDDVMPVPVRGFSPVEVSGYVCHFKNEALGCFVADFQKRRYQLQLYWRCRSIHPHTQPFVFFVDHVWHDGATRRTGFAAHHVRWSSSAGRGASTARGRCLQLT